MSSYKRPVGRPSGGQQTGRFDVGLTKEELKQCEEQAYHEFEDAIRWLSYASVPHSLNPR